MKKILITVVIIVMALPFAKAQNGEIKMPNKEGEVLFVNKDVTLKCVHSYGWFYLTNTNTPKPEVYAKWITPPELSEMDIDEIIELGRELKDGDGMLRNAFHAAFTEKEILAMKDDLIWLTPVWNNDGDIIYLEIGMPLESTLATMAPEKIATLFTEITKNVKFVVPTKKLYFYTSGTTIMLMGMKNLLDPDKPLLNKTDGWYGVEYMYDNDPTY